MIATYQQWVDSLGLPIHRGYYIEDLRTVALGWWAERGCNAAFIQLSGHEGILETRVTGIPPGQTTRPCRMALDDVYYVLEGKGLATVWGAEHGARTTFEWQKRSLFLIPRQSFYQLTNAQGAQPATLLSHNYLPVDMEAIADPEFFFNNPYLPPQGAALADFYSEARKQPARGEADYSWYGNFFPDMGVWDKLEPYRQRGAGGHVVSVTFPSSSRGGGVSMSVFPAGRYKKAHRHVAGNFIVIPAGEGFSLIWEEGKEKIFIPWHEASCFAPQFYHQHFNLGTTPARYLKFGYGWGGIRRYGNRYLSPVQIEYPDEDPWIRQTFEKELSKRGLTSLMPDGVYQDRDYQWEYAADSDAD